MRFHHSPSILLYSSIFFLIIGIQFSTNGHTLERYFSGFWVSGFRVSLKSPSMLGLTVTLADGDLRIINENAISDYDKVFLSWAAKQNLKGA